MIQEVIRAVVDTMTANGDVFSFLHSESEWQNLASDEGVFPAVYLDMPVKFTPEINKVGNIENVFNCSVLFLYKSNLDDNEVQRYESVTKAMAAQRQFQLKLDRYTEFVKTLTVGECYQVQNLFDANLDAVVMPFRMTLHNVQSVCSSATPLLGSLYEIKDTQGNVLYSGFLTLGQTLNQTIQNSSIKNSLGTEVDSVLSEAEGLAPDGTATNSDASYSLTVPSGTDVPIPDTQFIVQFDGVSYTTTLPTLGTNTLNIVLQ